MTERERANGSGPDSTPSSRRISPSRLLAIVGVLALLATVPLIRLLVPVAVRSHAIVRGPVVAEVYGRGTVESRRESRLGFDLAGRVVAVLVDEGDRVTVGEELARLDPEQYEAELRTASSSVDAARAALHRLAAEESQARTSFDAAVREERRIEPMVAAGVAPSRDLDLARDQRVLARDALDRVTAQIAEASRGIEVARGSAEQSRVTTVRTTLLAPFDGYVARRFREPGDTVAVGATVLHLVDTEYIQVEAWLDENTLHRLAEGQPVTIRFPGLDADFAGSLVRIAKEADRQTHELQVDIELEQWPERFVVGQRADAWVQIEQRPDVVRIPNAFIRREGGATFCYVDRSGKIDRESIQLGLSGRDVVEVVSGLSAHATVLDAEMPGKDLPLGRRWKALP